ncbi:MAG TPA: ethanolamine ammonia-lyase subunit EutC [Methylibium sp.]|uniref:ethanolamine ammonia-lyase subunit EutC n=1 Tax=Methylibium sp. TaxID=2067992 RepID=UPI002DBF1BA6|nr:ethanolamine ammonia-lyase subunit EutC [Methylibium sp.]HEU4458841.1 ethanolamine ammonia-lyase subunit EutC [Methylibium sp.]
MSDADDGRTLPVTPQGWRFLRRHTDARIALGRAGRSLPTTAQLDFAIAHAQARDAVHLAFDIDAIDAALKARGLETLRLRSAAPDRAAYLQRPDLGRRLDKASRAALAGREKREVDLAIVVADGLSALAIHRHALPLIEATLARLDGWRLAPIALVEQGRVAIGDEIGEALGARCVAVLIGERPGLSSPDSLGIYLSWAPRVGLADSARNCISNVRAAGLAIDAAAGKLHQLLADARRLQLTGIGLKDERDDQAAALEAAGDRGNFLLGAP